MHDIFRLSKTNNARFTVASIVKKVGSVDDEDSEKMSEMNYQKARR